MIRFFDNKLFFEKIPSFLFIILPILLISGPFLSDFSITLISLLFLIKCIQEKNFSFFKNNFFYIFLLFWFYLCLNSIFNNTNISSLKISFGYIRFGIFVIALTFLLSKNHKILEKFFISLLICFVILIIDSLYQYFNGYNLIGLPYSGGRLSSFFGSELILGSYLSRFLPILFGLSIMFKEKSLIKFKILFFIFVLTEAVVFLSGERTALFYINLSAFYILFMIKDFKILRLTMILTSTIVVLIILSFNNTAKTRVIDQTLKDFNLNFNDKLLNKGHINQDAMHGSRINIFSLQHTHHYISAYRMFKENPLFGVGVKNFRNFCNDKKFKVSKLSCSTHPHNTYIQLISELGLLGLIIPLSLLLLIIYKSIKHFFMQFKKKYLFNNFQICMISAVLITLWPLAPTGSFFNNYLNIIYFIPIALFMFDYKKQN